MYQLNQSKNIIIFGYSDLGRIIYEELLNEYKIARETICFCDNSPYKQQHNAEPKVIGVEEATKEFPDGKFIVASIYHFPSMKEQLLTLGVEDCNILQPSQNSLADKEKGDIFCRTTPRKELQFEVSLAEHCNLNCKGCNAFSPLANEQFPDIEHFENDFNQLSDLFHGHIGMISLVGGEPLLNRDIIQFMKISRENFIETEIRIVTNGILLKSVDEEFWNACKKYGIGITITKYPINIDYNGILEKASVYGVKCNFFGNALDHKYMFHFPLDIHGEQDAKDSFAKCMNANNCITLQDSKLYTCSIAPRARWLERAFGVELKMKDEDGIDIYKVKSGDEILNLLSKPISFCKYCNVKNRTYDGDWALSQKVINEWT